MNTTFRSLRRNGVGIAGGRDGGRVTSGVLGGDTRGVPGGVSLPSTGMLCKTLLSPVSSYILTFVCVADARPTR